MNDNARDELRDVLAHWPIGSGYYATDVDAATAGEMADAVLAHLAERGMVVLGPDGEPLDVRPALRAARMWGGSAALASFGITGPLASTCLAAAETDPS